MTFRQFFLALRYRWRSATVVLAATAVLVVLLGTLLMPTRYRAAAEILIQDETRDPIAGVALPGGPPPNRIITEADVIRSERVVMRALKAMGALDNPLLRAQWLDRTEGRGDYGQWLVEHVLKTTDVRPTRESRVLFIAHTSKDPAFAAAFVNALVRSYIDTSVDLRLEPAKQYNAFFDERVSELRQRLHTAQQKVSEFHRRNDITTTDERLDVEDARLAELSAQVVSLQARAGEAQRRQREAALSPDRMEEALKDPTVSALAGALALQEAAESEMLERLGPRHPRVIESRASTAALAARLQQAKRRVASSFEGGSEVLTGQLAERTRALEEQRAKVLKRRALRDEARLLQAEVDGAQKTYDAVIERLNKTAMETAAPQVGVTILQAAAIPSVPTTPSLKAKASAGSAAGVLLAVFAISLLELRDRRLRDADDVRGTLKQPVLGVLRPRATRAAASPAYALLGQARPALTGK